MKTVRAETIKVEHDKRLTIEDAKIGDKSHSICLSEWVTGDGLSIEFSEDNGEEADFVIHIDASRGIMLKRHRYRPNHDHDDREYLCLKNGELCWSKDASPTEIVRIPFGSVED